MSLTPRIDNLEARGNVMINGNFDFWQRGTSSANFGSGSGVYRADRWAGWENMATAVLTTEQDTDVPSLAQSGFPSDYSALVKVSANQASVAASEGAIYQQIIEGYNFAGIKSKTITLSFWVKSSVTGTYCLSFRNNGADRSYVEEYEIHLSNTWEHKTITLDWNPVGGTDNYVNGSGARIGFVLAVGNTFQTTPNVWQTGNYFGTSNQVNFAGTLNAEFRLAQVRLHIGEEAGDFHRAGKLITEELELCQRYYVIGYGTHGYASGITTICNTPIPVELRTFPSVIGAINGRGNGASGVITYVPNVSEAVTGGCVHWRGSIPLGVSPAPGNYQAFSTYQPVVFDAEL
jgi:hypothetical protein